jgi:hypothetical protein
MSPTARKVARLAGEVESAATRLKNLIPDLQSLDLESRALKNSKSAGLVFTDNDLWGLQSFLIFGQQSGYSFDNPEWTQNTINRIDEARIKLQEQIFPE